MSLPSRERGLKYLWEDLKGEIVRVAPLAGAWIEIFPTFSFVTFASVAPLAGAWIEI